MCYKGSKGVVNGDQARRQCESMEAVLVSIHNENTARLISTLMDR